jgi:hypothetical protein
VGASLYEDAFDAPSLPVPEEQITEDEFSAIHQGHLKDSGTIGSHSYAMRTLKVGEELEATTAAARFSASIDYHRAVKTALIAAALTSWDGKPLIPNPVGPEDEEFEAKFNAALGKFFAPTVDALYERYQALMERLQDTADKTKKE